MRLGACIDPSKPTELTLLGQQTNKRVKMSNYSNAQTSIANKIANPIWTAVCFCKKCANKEFIKISLLEFAKKADDFGFDLTDDKQLRKMNHLVISQVA